MDHLRWMEEITPQLSSSEGHEIKQFAFLYDISNEAVLNRWADHLRNHYCSDSDIEYLIDGMGISKKKFLEEYKFPSMNGFGPSIRAGDFGEILLADYNEFVLNCWVPRTRYVNKTISDESTKGCDLISFFIHSDESDPRDTLNITEVKTQFSGASAKPRLQNAIDDSAKDELRKAESLNAMKQRFLDKDQIESAIKVSRFQNFNDKPYQSQYFAAALFSNPVYCIPTISASTVGDHPYIDQLRLLVVKGEDMMSLVHNLYKLASERA